MIADILSNTKFNPVLTGLFHRGKKLNISLLFITQSYFAESEKCCTKFYTLFDHENSK